MIFNAPISDLKGAISSVEDDLSPIHATGSSNTTGDTITKGTFFYLNGTLVQATADISNNAPFNSVTNYRIVTAGGLNSLHGVILAVYGNNQTVQAGSYLDVDIPVNANDYFSFFAPIYSGNGYGVITNLWRNTDTEVRVTVRNFNAFDITLDGYVTVGGIQ